MKPDGLLGECFGHGNANGSNGGLAVAQQPRHLGNDIGAAHDEHPSPPGKRVVVGLGDATSTQLAIDCSVAAPPHAIAATLAYLAAMHDLLDWAPAALVPRRQRIKFCRLKS
jgi:hypothetical protein